MFIQLQVEARDISDSPRSAYTDVSVIVVRNENSPVFEPARYTSSATDYDVPGTLIATVTANDPDRNNIYNRDVSITPIPIYIFNPFTPTDCFS